GRFATSTSMREAAWCTPDMVTRASSRSVAVTMPTRRPSSMTGMAPIFRMRIVLAVSSMGSPGCAVSTSRTISELTGSPALTPGGAFGWSAPTKRTSRSETMPTRASGLSGSARPSRIGKCLTLRCSIRAWTSRMGVSGPMATTLRVMTSETSISVSSSRLPAAGPQALELVDHARRGAGADARHQPVGGVVGDLGVRGLDRHQPHGAVEPLQHAPVAQLAEAGARQVVVPAGEGREDDGVGEAAAGEGGLEHALGEALAAVRVGDLHGAQLDQRSAPVVPPGLHLGGGVERHVAHELSGRRVVSGRDAA